MHQGGNSTLLKRIVVTAVFCLLASLSLEAQEARNNRAASGRPAIVDIRQIDFWNFTYALNGRDYKLIDGLYAENLAPGTRWELAVVDGPFYGELTGDGKDEVAFVLSYGTPEKASTAEARIYTLRQGRPLLLATLVVKENVACVLDHYIRVGDGMVSLERIRAVEGRCQYNEITEYRWNGSSFVPMGASLRAPCRCM
jgi:hypothetical protein